MDNLLERSLNSLGICALTFAIFKTCKIIWFIKFKCYIFKKYGKDKIYSQVSSFRECVENTVHLLNRDPIAYRVLGMDCENTSGSGKGNYPVPAILQLAVPNGYCAIFKVKLMEDTKIHISSRSVYTSHLQLPSGLTVLAQILEDPTILKVGVGILEDARYLQNRYGLVTKGCLDVRHLAQELNIKPSGLDELGLKLLGEGKEPYKHRNAAPWESEDLPIKQLNYAVQDARLGVNIFMELIKRYICHHHSLWERLFWDEKAFWKYVMKHCEKFVGKQFYINKDENPIVKCNSWLNYVYDRIGRTWYIPECSGPSAPVSIVYCCKCKTCFLGQSFVAPVVPVDYNIENQELRELCPSCLKSNLKENYIIREKLTEMCGAPYPDYQDTRLVKAKHLAECIMKSTNKESEQYELNQFRLCEMLDISRKQLNDRTLQVILTMDCWPGSSHGQFVHDYFNNFQRDKLAELRRFWEDSRINFGWQSRY